MKYDFDEIIDRRHSGSYKWDGAPEDVLPLWVADMDFKVAPPIQRALERRVSHGIFGYVKVPDSYYEALIGWFERRHAWKMEREWVIYTSGVVPAVSAIIKAMTVPGDGVLVLTPVYNCFFSSIRNNGCEIVSSDLVYENGTYHIDFDDFEAKADKARVFLLCNPHNPAGRVWTREELLRLGEICLRKNVFVISDEIHCELVMPGYHYTPWGTLGEDFLYNSAICTSPSKSFNTAGLQIANITAADSQVRGLIDRAINVNEVCDVNPFGVVALEAAYNECEDWLMQLLDYIHENYRILMEFQKKHLPDFPVARLEGTYLAWMDCAILGKDSQSLEDDLMGYGLWLNAGIHYGKSGDHFLRWNLACTHSVLEAALERFLRYVCQNK